MCVHGMMDAMHTAYEWEFENQANFHHIVDEKRSKN